MKNMEDKLENSIMGKIKAGQVKLRSRYVFLAEKLGLGTAFALSVILAVLFFNLILFYMKETDNLKYLSFGKFGVFAFLESFPYLLVISFIFLIVLAGYLMTKSDESYKKPFGYLSIGLVAVIVVFGGILTYTNIAQSIEMEARKNSHPLGMFFNPFMRNGTEVRNRGVAGMVFETGENYLVLQAPNGLRRVDMTGIDQDKLPQLKRGDFVIGIGGNQGEDFVAEDIRIIDRNDIPSVDRGIDYKFQPFLDRKLDDNNVKSLPPNLFYFPKEDQDCIGKCFDSGAPAKECFDSCQPK